MSNLERIGKQRFSRRQITKRAFQIGSDIDRKPASGKKEKLVQTPAKDKQPLKRTRYVEETPPGLQECSGIGNVSVSFLASTPKPGKTQLSRRRPLSSVQESEISKAGSGQQKATEKTNSLGQCVDNETYKLSHPTNASESVNSSKRKSLSKSKLSETNVSTTRSSAVKISRHITATSTSHPSKSSTVIDKSGDHMNPYSEKIKRKQPAIKDSGIKGTHDSSHRKKSDNVITRKRVSEDVPAVAAKKRKVSKSETSVLLSRSPNPPFTHPPGSSKTVQMTKNKRQTIAKKTRDKPEEVPENNDLTVVDISLQNKRNCHGNKIKPTKLGKTATLKQTATRVRNEEKNIPVQTVKVYQDGGNHKKSDLMDLDVALSTLTETLQTQLDECETQKEQAAVRLLEKYLVQDISQMISDMQRVKKLQGKIRKGRQSLKERQKTLMSLQMKKPELLVSKNRQGDEKQSAENMKDINAFLENMKSFIEQL